MRVKETESKRQREREIKKHMGVGGGGVERREAMRPNERQRGRE